MFNSILSDIRSVFHSGHMVNRLMLVNFMVWIGVMLLKLLTTIFNGGDVDLDTFDNILHYICMPGHWDEAIFRPWAFFSSMFLHEGFWHLITNLMFMYMFGTIVGDLIGDRKVLPVYIIGGLVGNVLFMLSDFWKHYPVPYALGASGAVMALAGASVTLNPDYRVMLMFLGEVKLKYIVLVLVLLDLVGIAHNDNTGGHVAHIGGFLTGIFLISRLRDGQDVIEPTARFFDKISNWVTNIFNKKPTRRKPKMAYRGQNLDPKKANHRSDNNDLSYQEKLDAILDKIKENGYENLSQEEKDFLFNASKR